MLTATDIHTALGRMDETGEFEKLVEYAPNEAERTEVERFAAALDTFSEQVGEPFMPLPLVCQAPKTVLADLLMFLMGGDDE